MQKTPDEIKKGLAYCVEPYCPGEKCPYWNAETCATDKTYDALAYIQQLEAERDAAVGAMPRWISVEERLPEDHKIVLLGYIRGNIVDCGYIDTEEAEWCNYESIKVKTPTHWMPLPEPPKEE